MLPRVKEEIGYSIAESIGDDDAEFIMTEIKKIEMENPVIADFIGRWSQDPKTVFCGILVYKLLRSQAEADKMNEEFK